jgi:hypothetical protein
VVVETTTGNSRTVLYNTLNRPASQTITHRGMAMIPLRYWGHTWDWRMPRKKNCVETPYICQRVAKYECKTHTSTYVNESSCGQYYCNLLGWWCFPSSSSGRWPFFHGQWRPERKSASSELWGRGVEHALYNMSPLLLSLRAWGGLKPQDSTGQQPKQP